MDMTISPDVIQALHALADGRQRRILGIVGAPGAGKSTLAALLQRQARLAMASLPMDGFHLSQSQLDLLGRRARKGAPDTFDSHGYRDILKRLRRTFGRDETVYAPGFHRDIEEPIAASLAIPPDASLVVTEGNYLLLDTPDWQDIAATLDEIWYLHTDTALRERWLSERHQQFGSTEAQAMAWVARTDRPNGELIATTAKRADRQLQNDGQHIAFL